jgi:hypothetical protein
MAGMDGSLDPPVQRAACEQLSQEAERCSQVTTGCRGSDGTQWSLQFRDAAESSTSVDRYADSAF